MELCCIFLHARHGIVLLLPNSVKYFKEVLSILLTLSKASVVATISHFDTKDTKKIDKKGLKHVHSMKGKYSFDPNNITQEEQRIHHFIISCFYTLYQYLLHTN